MKSLTFEYTSEKNSKETCLVPCPTVIRGMNTLKILPAFWRLLAPSKKHQVNNFRCSPFVNVLLYLHQVNEGHDKFCNILSILLPLFGKMCSTICNFKQRKWIIDTGSQHIDKRDSLDVVPLPKTVTPKILASEMRVFICSFKCVT